MPAKKRMTLTDHIKVAAAIEAIIEVMPMIRIVLKKNPVNSVLHKSAARFYPTLTRLQHDLDADYHSITTDKVFEKYGHIYYGPARKKVAAMVCNVDRPENNFFILEIETGLMDGFYRLDEKGMDDIKNNWDKRRPGKTHVLCNTPIRFDIPESKLLNRTANLEIVS